MEATDISIVSFKQEMSKSLFQNNGKWKLTLKKTKKHGYLIHTWSGKALKGTGVIQALSSFDRGSLEITLTVPLRP